VVKYKHSPISPQNQPQEGYLWGSGVFEVFSVSSAVPLLWSEGCQELLLYFEKKKKKKKTKFFLVKIKVPI